MIILGIETSCDETAASVVKGSGDKVEVLSNAVSSQIEIHKKYGGVVPEVAARQHVLNILPVVNEALEQAGIISAAAPERVDAIAVTVGPGLITSLLVGVETAKTLAYAWKLPVVAINHIEGHIYANWLKPIGVMANDQFSMTKQTQNSKLQIKNQIKFPAIILTVSGGHTMLVLMAGHGKYKLLGETRDDAAGEAFDKAAQMLNIGYPGGPAVAKYAEKFKQKSTDVLLEKVSLPRPMIRDKNLDFSFSGLKTALLYALEKDPSRLRGGAEASKNWQKNIPVYAAEFQQAIVEVLIHKTIKAAKALNCKTIMLSGGVAANIELRSQLKAAVQKNLAGAKLIIPELKYCTDNAAMIATAGYFRARKKGFTPWQKLKTEANLELK